MPNDKNEKTLDVSMGLLGIPEDCIVNNVPFSDVNVLNTLIVYGVSKEALGNPICTSKCFRNLTDHKKYFTWLSEQMALPYIVGDSETDYKSLISSNCFVIPDGMTVLKFYEAIRNSIAHKNIVLYRGKFIFFMAFAGKGSSKSIKKAWTSKTSMLIVLDKIDDIAKFGTSLMTYSNQFAKQEKDVKI